MPKEKIEFKTEVNQLLDLMIHSLYSEKEIFLRELISNSSDAIDKLSFLSQTNDSLLKDSGGDFKIRIIPNKTDKTLTIEDNGIGLNHDDLIKHLGTIAKSGTKEFVNNLKKVKDNPELIGQFGVGFYSSFMVCDKIEVTTRKAGEKDAFIWTSDGKGSFEIEKGAKKVTGTSIVLHMKKDQEEFLEEERIKNIVKKYSDFISYPIYLEIEKDKKKEDEIINSQKAIWLRSKSGIKDEEYCEFYKYLTHDNNDPLAHIHQHTEGTIEFKSLIYIPKNAPYNLFHPNSDYGLNLYIKKTFITNDCKDLIPQYLRFVKGVVDNSDLPLNVSREILQNNPLLIKIRNTLVKKILSTLKGLKEKQYDKYLEFYTEFGKLLKEGVHEDIGNRESLLDLLLFESINTENGKFITLKQYVEKIQKDQKEIYYITGESRIAIENSPHLEILKKKGVDVLLLTDPIDEWWISSVFEFEKLQFKQAGGVIENVESEKEKEENLEKQKTFSSLLGVITQNLANDVKEVKASSKLVNSPVCLVSDGMSTHMEKIMKSMGQQAPDQKKILEINLEHPVIKKMQTIYDLDQKSTKLGRYSKLLFNQALMTEGLPVKNMHEFLKDLNELMAN